MLDDNNYNNSTCAFAEQSVSYLYGEINAAEKTVFETHLRSCSTCAEEFASFSQIHFSVIEWRNEEFLSLEMPSMEISYEKTRALYPAKTGSGVSPSWISELRRLFSLSPTFAAATAFALLVFCVGIVFFAAKSSNNLEVVDRHNKTNEKTIASATNDKEIPANSIGDSTEINGGGNSPGNKAKFSGGVVKDGNRQTIADSRIARRDSIVKIADDSRNAANKFNREANAPMVKTLRAENKKPFLARTNKIPRLNNVEEEEDESLRLAELLDDGADK